MTTSDRVKETAIIMAKEIGLINVTCKALCERSKIADGSFVSIMGAPFAQIMLELKDECPPSALGKVKKNRANPELRKEHLIDTAIQVCELGVNFNKLTRLDVANAAGVSEGLISNHFGTMPQFKRDIMRHAIRRGIVSIIAQGLAIGDENARKAPQELKDKAGALLASS